MIVKKIQFEEFANDGWGGGKTDIYIFRTI